ncbi:UNC93-like protein [Pseudocercospora fuligena]|uniref:UNC93-like protein n=1 Tax=Pseudocercospora fuligena TaxID=685502 RepID=A0A8H6RM99_9PEZI|nr:UNC93-like protein [Pseudocercospora fuligena]
MTKKSTNLGTACLRPKKNDQMAANMDDKKAPMFNQQEDPNPPTLNITEITTPPQGHKILGLNLPAYRSPIVQTLLVSLVQLLVVGIFNVLAALGGGGQVNPTTSNNANTILYSLFAAFSLLAGSVTNYLGPKWTLATGGVGYSLLAASFWCYNHTKNRGFVYFGGATCGISAAFLWTAAGSLIMSLPLEKDKGSVVGAIIPTVENWSVTTAGTVNDGTYIALFILMFSGSIVALFVADPKTIVRIDGSRAQVPRETTFVQELKNVVVAVQKEPLIFLFFPFSFAGLWYIPYQSNDFNAYFFDLRTRGFAGLWYNFGQLCITRAFINWTFLFVFLNAVLIGGIWPVRESHRGVPPAKLLSVGQSKASGYIALLTFYGCIDGAWQTFAWWIMGALSNDPVVLSIYSSFYKVFGATGCAIVFSLDNHGTPHSAMFGSYWGLLSGSMLLVLYLIHKRIGDTSKEQEVTLQTIPTKVADSALM